MLWMEEILHQLLTIVNYEILYDGVCKLPTNWCRIPSIHSI